MHISISISMSISIYMYMYIYWNLDLEDKVHSISWDLWTSNLQECKGNMLFLKSSGTWNNFRSGSNNLEKFLEGCPNPLSTSPYKLVGGGYTVHNIIQPVGFVHNLGICQLYSMGPSNKVQIFVYYSYIQVEFGNLCRVVLRALCARNIVHPNIIFMVYSSSQYDPLKMLFIATLSLKIPRLFSYYSYWHYSWFVRALVSSYF